MFFKKSTRTWLFRECKNWNKTRNYRSKYGLVKGSGFVAASFEYRECKHFMKSKCRLARAARAAVKSRAISVKSRVIRVIGIGCCGRDKAAAVSRARLKPSVQAATWRAICLSVVLLWARSRLSSSSRGTRSHALLIIFSTLSRDQKKQSIFRPSTLFFGARPEAFLFMKWRLRGSSPSRDVGGILFLKKIGRIIGRIYWIYGEDGSFPMLPELELNTFGKVCLLPVEDFQNKIRQT